MGSAVIRSHLGERMAVAEHDAHNTLSSVGFTDG
jgi:hypothetical protein